MPSFYKKGTDVYEVGQSNPITQGRFQELGLNFDLLSTDQNAPTVLESARDTETKAYIAGGGQLGTANAAVNAGYQTAGAGTGKFTYTPPSTFEANTLKNAQEAATSRQETTDMLNKAIAERNKTISETALAIQPTPEEEALRARKLGFEQQQQTAIESVQERSLDGAALTGGIQSEISNISQGKTRESLVNLRNQQFISQELGLLEAKRQSKIQALEIKLKGDQANVDDLYKMRDYINEEEQDQFDRELKLTEFQQEVLDNMVTGLEGLSFSELNIDTQNQLKRLAKETGMDLGAIVGKLELAKNKLVAQKTQQEFENRLALQREDRLGEDKDTEFTNTQINKGASVANMSIADFVKLDKDTQNFFINNANMIKDQKGIIDQAKIDEEDPEALEGEISSSNLPGAVKDLLVKYVWSVFPRPTAKSKAPWWQFWK